MVPSLKSCKSVIRVYLFGPPQVFVDGHEIPDRAWGRKLAKKIFCYLVMRRDEGFSCQDLCEAFWPAASLRRGHESLRSVLNAIRKVLREAGVKGPVVEMGDGRCHLDPGLNIWLDGKEMDVLFRKVHREKGRERQERLVDKALSLVRGAFCEGWDDPWVARLERRFNAERLDIVRAFGKACLEHGRVAESIPCFEKTLTLDGLHEETCRNLMTAYALLGRKKDVKGVFEELKARLYMELHVRPEVETKRLYHRLIRGPRLKAKEVAP